MSSSQGLRFGRLMRPVRREFFGMHLVGTAGWDQAGTSPTNTPLHTFGCGSLRIWDCGVTWRLIETSKGVFDWSRLDAEMAVWDQGYGDIVFTLGQPPNWASTPNVGSGSYNPYPPNNVSDAADFVTALLLRYPQITSLEHWNEPENSTFYNGTVSQLAAISKAQADAARAVRPDIVMVGACPQSFGDRGDYLRQYLAALTAIGAQDAIDVVSFHTYVMPREPEYIGILIDLLRAIMICEGFNLPIWSTEFGWGGIPSAPGGAGFYDDVTGAYINTTASTMSQSQAAAYITRSYLVSLAKGLERQYFYAVDKSFSAIRLIDFAAKGSVLGSGGALTFLTRMLVGGWIGPLIDRGNIRSVEIISTIYGRGRAFWCRDRNQVTANLSKYRSVRNVNGEIASAPTSSYAITNSPIYAFS